MNLSYARKSIFLMWERANCRRDCGEYRGQ
jgi:hypothetical protein